MLDICEHGYDLYMKMYYVELEVIFLVLVFHIWYLHLLSGTEHISH